MAKACEDCGTRLLSNGVCPNCDEEMLIFEQAPDYEFSAEFMEMVSDGEQRAANRKYAHKPM
jgi:hypothetical protein